MFHVLVKLTLIGFPFTTFYIWIFRNNQMYEPDIKIILRLICDVIPFLDFCIDKRFQGSSFYLSWVMVLWSEWSTPSVMSLSIWTIFHNWLEVRTRWFCSYYFMWELRNPDINSTLWGFTPRPIDKYRRALKYQPNQQYQFNLFCNSVKPQYRV